MLLEAIITSASDGIVVLDENGKYILINPTYARWMGLSAADLIGEKPYEWIHPDDREKASRCFTKALKGHSDITEIRIKGSDQEYLILQMTSTPMKWWDRPNVLWVATDITERRKLEEELTKSQKLESLGVLAGGIAHDFNNILAGMLINISFAKALSGPGEKVYSLLQEAENASLRAKELTHQLLTFSKGWAPLKEAVLITDLIQESAKFILRGSNIKCEFSFGQNLWTVEVDKGQINQVLNNLLINAQQAMPAGGTIEIGVNLLGLDDNEISQLAKGKYINISIKDHGIGISEGNLGKIFDPFFTTKEEGSGLGLSTTYSIIRKHQGVITVDSKMGEGTVFNIFLPAIDGILPESSEGKRTYAALKGKVLIMDDDEVIRNCVGEFLQTMGCEVFFALEGAEAVEHYQQAMNSDRSFDVVILDLTIPGGMGGQETMMKLRELDPEVKAIVTSGYSNSPVMANYKKYGFSGVISKPFELSTLTEILSGLLPPD